MVIRHRMWDRACPNPRFFLYENVGSLHRNWAIWTHAISRSTPNGHETLHTHPSHHHIHMCKVSWPSDVEREIACTPNPSFLLYKNVGSLHRELAIWTHASSRSASNGHETLHMGPSHHHTHTCKVSRPSDTECVITRTQIPRFLLYENVGSLHRNWQFGHMRSHVQHRMTIETLHTGPSHHHIHTCKVSKAIRHRMWDHAHPNPHFLLYENEGSPRRNLWFGRTRSHVLHRMAMKLCTHVHPITIYICANFQGHPTPNVRSRAPKSPFFTIRKCIHRICDLGSRDLTFDIGWPWNFAHAGPSHHYIHRYKISWPSDTECEITHMPKSPHFLLYENEGSLHRNWRFGRTRSHVQHRMAMKLCMRDPCPITIYIRAKFHGHTISNVRSRAPKSSAFYYTKM